MSEADPTTGHHVGFYDRDETLIAAVVGELGPALKAGDPVVIVATPAHLAAFEEALASDGVDVEDAREQGRLGTVDADRALRRLLIAGEVDARRFHEVIGGLIARAGGRRKVVHVYGELVAELVRQGRTRQALALEDRWNDLALIVPLRLFCAYPMGSLEELDDRAVFEGICERHATVAPTPAFASLETSQDRIRTAALLEHELRSASRALARGEQHRDEDLAALADARAQHTRAMQRISDGLHELRNAATIVSMALEVMGTTHPDLHANGEVSAIARALAGTERVMGAADALLETADARASTTPWLAADHVAAPAAADAEVDLHAVVAGVPEGSPLLLLRLVPAGDADPSEPPGDLVEQVVELRDELAHHLRDGDLVVPRGEHELALLLPGELWRTAEAVGRRLETFWEATGPVGVHLQVDLVRFERTGAEGLAEAAAPAPV